MRGGRILLVASAFVIASLLDFVGTRDEAAARSFMEEASLLRSRGGIGPGTTATQWDAYSRDRPYPYAPSIEASGGGNATTSSSSRLGYVRPPGRPEELLALFETVSDPARIARLPRTPREIAARYGLVETPRRFACPTSVGWIPSAAKNSTAAALDSERSFSHQGKIPRLLFQSWKTSALSGRLCDLVGEWSELNPSWDHFLFDDAAVDRFVRMEYGEEIFSSYACVKVGAAKCDVWRLLVIYLFGGAYFDADVRPAMPFDEWNWGDDRDVVTGRSCNARRKHPGGCAHQWGMIYAPFHPVIKSAIVETLTNLARRDAGHVYDISFWSYYHAWRNGPYNQSYVPGWGEAMGGRVKFQDDGAKDDMVGDNGHWQDKRGKEDMWHAECL